MERDKKLHSPYFAFFIMIKTKFFRGTLELDY